MRIRQVHVENFQSYRDLDFVYEDLGLSLVSGVTGSGKSTLLDAPAWILFGITSKDSNADDVKAWDSEGPTLGRCEVVTPAGAVTVTRIRGKRPADNDLHYATADGQIIRGKDMNDTQKKLEKLLGVTADLFLTGSYLHQFSKADGFFVANAKDRRKTTESIADLTLAVTLGDRASAARKVTKADLEKKELEAAREAGKYEEAVSKYDDLITSEQRWEETQAGKILDLQTKADNFESDKDARIAKILAQLEELDRITVSPKDFDGREAQVKQQLKALEQVRKEHSDQNAKLYAVKADRARVAGDLDKAARLKSSTCPTCMGPVDNPNRAQHLRDMTADLADLTETVKAQDARVRDLEEALKVEEKLRKDFDKTRSDRASNDRLLDRFETLQREAITLRATVNAYAEHAAAARAEKNPFGPKCLAAAEQRLQLQVNMGRIDKDVEALRARLIGLNWLYDKSFELRGALMAKAVRQINDGTNKYLERYFDAAIRVKFALTDSDKLDVEINNGGHSCPFKQLSGGERRMLTLCFSIALMRAAQNKAGIDFPMIMLDEALNGLDDGLKVKAFGLLQELESDYETVLLIEHSSDLKQCFSRVFSVGKEDGYSKVTEPSIELRDQS